MDVKNVFQVSESKNRPYEVLTMSHINAMSHEVCVTSLVINRNDKSCFNEKFAFYQLEQGENFGCMAKIKFIPE